MDGCGTKKYLVLFYALWVWIPFELSAMLKIPITEYKVPFQGFLQTEQDCYSVEYLSMTVYRGETRRRYYNHFQKFFTPPPLLENLSMCLFISSLKKPSNESSSELFGANSHLFVRVILGVEFWNKIPTKTPTFRQFSSFSVYF